MKISYKILSTFLLCILLVGCNEDQVDLLGAGEIIGKVVEAETFEPIENVKVSITPTGNTAFTDENGEFSIVDVPAGDYSAQAEKDGYLAKVEGATVTADNVINVIFEMEDETALNKPPSAPIIISPADNSTGLNIELDLVWNVAIDPDLDDLTYQVTVRNDFDDSVIEVENLTDTIYTLTDLKYGVKYFWQLTVSDDINDPVLSPISVFETNKFPGNRFFYVRKNELNSNHQIYSSNEDASIELTITTEDQNSWRPRVNQASGLVAFLRSVNTETHIFTMNPDGSDIKQVTSAVPVAGFDQNEVDYSWSSNGDRLIYPSFDKLYLINKDGSGLELIYQTPDGSFITECDWSSDESFIALKTNNLNGYEVSIFTIDISGAILKTILSGVNGAAGGLNISVDNQRLLYTWDVSGFEDASYRQLNSRMFIYNLSADTVLDVSGDKVDGTNDLDPRFSPNEASIIFINTSNDGISQRDIHMSTAIGEERVQMFNNGIMVDWE